jgi:hypothetical protein
VQDTHPVDVCTYTRTHQGLTNGGAWQWRWRWSIELIGGTWKQNWWVLGSLSGLCSFKALDPTLRHTSWGGRNQREAVDIKLIAMFRAHRIEVLQQRNVTLLERTHIAYVPLGDTLQEHAAMRVMR